MATVSRKRSGEPYERLALTVFGQLMTAQGVKLDRLEHDVVLHGKTVAHQIDVLWDFTVGGIGYQTLIQAKDWTRPVDQGEVLKFRAVLDDIPGQPRGVMISRSGFQAGAHEIARNHGIKLYQLGGAESGDEPHGQIIWDITAYVRRYEIRPIVDTRWFREQAKLAGLAAGETVDIGGKPAEMIVTDASGNVVMRLSDVIRRFFPTEPCKMERHPKRYEFDQAAFLPTTNPRLSRMKVLGIEGDIWTEEISFTASVEFHAMVTWLLKDIIEDTSTALDADGKPIHVEPVTRLKGKQWAEQPDLPP